MNGVINTEKRPIKLWVTDADAETLRQARNLANLPFAFSHVALMPDAHVGFGMPIGGVLATQEVIIPNAVGVDIGCGMCAIQTNLDSIDKQNLKTILSKIRTRIPLGFKWHDKKQDAQLIAQSLESCTVAQQEYEQALYQLGTLGGGNHFIEIQKDNSGKIWIMIHSGSRNIGKKVAKYYNNKAKKLNHSWFSEVPASWDLAFLPLETQEARNYISEMNFCVNFALANRKLMMQRVCESILEVEKTASFGKFINIAHNYAAQEAHFGQQVWVHRKGATRAGNGETGIIPGSQGSNSFIVNGLGNPQSFESCSHGAGRKLGRNQAIKTLDLKAEIQQLDNKGIFHSIRTQKDLEEATGAYKDINEVMKNQSDLVEIIVTLAPLAVIKG